MRNDVMGTSSHDHGVCICNQSQAEFICSCGFDTGKHSLLTSVANIATHVTLTEMSDSSCESSARAVEPKQISVRGVMLDAGIMAYSVANQHNAYVTALYEIPDDDDCHFGWDDPDYEPVDPAKFASSPLLAKIENLLGGVK